MKLISLVVPCFNEQETIQIFYDEVLKIEKQLTDAEIEFRFVDDGSKDNTVKILRELSKKDSRVHYVSFSRNFGKEAALLAGLESSEGDYVATMDVDLQDPPSLLPQMWQDITNPELNLDCIATKRQTRKGEPVIRSFFANMFYKLINKMSDTFIENGARDYRLMNRKFVDAVIQDKEYNRFSKGIFSWVGFNTKWIAYDNVERSAGETKWSFFKLFKYSIEGILSYSIVPLYMASVLGLLMTCLAICALIFVIVRKIVFGDPTQGWASMVCIIIFIGGLLLLNMGVIGLYLSKIYTETKQRQKYIVREQQ